MFKANSASIYLYESKTNMFLLKKYCGEQPTRFSIAGTYEFLDLLRKQASSIARDEFISTHVNEYRQSALFYFQHTLANVVCPVFDDHFLLGLINVNFQATAFSEKNLFNTLLGLYAQQVSQWLQFQTLVGENRRHAELAHVKNELLSNVTHELQTPLNGILGMAEIILECSAEALQPEQRQQVQRIRESAKDLHKTVSDILHLVHIEAKKEKKQEKVNILGLIDEVALLFAESCQEKNIGIVTPKNGMEFFVYVNPDHIRTVLVNLVGNAVKFTAAGTVRVAVKKSGEMLHVCVADTGIGIDEDKLALIFEEFYQGDGSHTRVYGGTGLGLAIVKKIVDLYGGRVWVSSEKLVGSEFTFSLPTYPV